MTYLLGFFAILGLIALVGWIVMRGAVHDLQASDIPN